MAQHHLHVGQIRQSVAERALDRWLVNQDAGRLAGRRALGGAPAQQQAAPTVEQVEAIDGSAEMPDRRAGVGQDLERRAVQVRGPGEGVWGGVAFDPDHAQPAPAQQRR